MQPLELALAQDDVKEKLCFVYGKENLVWAQKRCADLLGLFETAFGRQAEGLFSAPGRTELGGNHTDHQCGRVLAAAIDLDILAAAAVSECPGIRVCIGGETTVSVELSDLVPRAEETHTSAALVRGVAARMTELGRIPQGAGVDICLVSDVPVGSGLSSSAAFEVLLGTVFAGLFCGGSAAAVELAQIGQYAENIYFGKPCGLMDQIACAVGGVAEIDFGENGSPAVEQTALDLAGEGYALCILDTGASHADLTGEYAAITKELKAVCGCFGKAVLREVAEEDFLSALPEVRAKAGDRAALRAMHVFGENRRVHQQGQALKRGDFEAFLVLVRDSGRSSAMYLQNLIPAGQTDRQEMMLTVALCEEILQGRGAVRVHGGGFGGTVQAYVPLDLLEQFKCKTEAVLGENCCRTVGFRPVGSLRLV